MCYYREVRHFLCKVCKDARFCLVLFGFFGLHRLVCCAKLCKEGLHSSAGSWSCWGWVGLGGLVWFRWVGAKPRGNISRVRGGWSDLVRCCHFVPIVFLLCAPPPSCSWLNITVEVNVALFWLGFGHFLWLNLINSLMLRCSG